MDMIGFNLLHFAIAEVACSSKSFHPRNTPWFIDFSRLPEKGSAVRGRVPMLEGREFRKTHASHLLTLAVVPAKAADGILHGPGTPHETVARLTIQNAPSTAKKRCKSYI
jgi:hypothetical protein